MEKISNNPIPNANELEGKMTRRAFLGKVGALVTASTLLPMSFGQGIETTLDYQKAYSAEKPEKNSYRVLLSEYPNIYRKPALHENNVFMDHPTLGRIATDGFSITHVLGNNGKYEHLERPEHLNIAPKERMANVLNYLYQYQYGYVNNDKSITQISNPYNLDQAEIKEYIETGKEGKSFVIAKNSNGDPCLVIATDPKSKLSRENGAVDAILKAIDKLNKYDPEIMDVLTREYMVRVLTGNTSLFNVNSESRTYSRSGAIIFNNDLIYKDNRVNYYTVALLMLSRYVGNARNTKINSDGSKVAYLYNKSKAYDNIDVESAVYANSMIEKYKGQMSSSDYQWCRDFSARNEQRKRVAASQQKK